MMLDENQPLSYADPETNRFRLPLDSAAKNSLVAGCLFFLTPIPPFIAIVLGIVGIERTRNGGVRGRWQAWTGLLLGILGIVFWIWLSVAIHHLLTSVQQGKLALDLRDLGQALHLYANDHQGKYPDSLETLIKASSQEALEQSIASDTLGDKPAPGSSLEEILSNFRTGQHTSFVYLGMGLTVTGQSFTGSMPGDTPVAFVSYASGGNARVSILYDDGHVEMFDRQPGLQIIQKRIDQIAQTQSSPKPK